MAGTELSNLTALVGSAVAVGDLLVIVDISDTSLASSGTDKKITSDELTKALARLGVVKQDSLYTTKGDLAAATAASTAVRLGVGTDGTILEANSAQTTGLQWGTAPIKNTLVDVKGDIITATANDVPARLGVGANGTILEANSAQSTGLQWGTAPIKNTLIDAKGDLLVGTADNVPARLGVGADNTVLEAASGQTAGVQWGTAPVKKATLTAKGSLYVATASATVVEQTVGTNTYALCADSALTNGVGWKNVWSLPQEINTQSGAAYTGVLTDAGKIVAMTNVNPTFTIPANASVAYPIGTQIIVKQGNTGQVTIGITTDTLNQPPGSPATIKTATVGSYIVLIKVAATLWDVTGDYERKIRTPVQVIVGSITAVLTTGTGKEYFRIPATLNGYDLVACAATVDVASTSGAPTIQLRRKRAGVDVNMLSTSLSIDANENDSSTAATAAVINTSNDDVLTADRIYIDVTAAGANATALHVEMTFA